MSPEAQIPKSTNPETNQIVLPAENIDVYSPVLPDIIKSTSLGNRLIVGQECLLGPDTSNDTVSGKMEQERHQNKAIANDGNNLGKDFITDDEMSDSNQQNWSFTSISEDIRETLEMDHDKTIQEQGMDKGNNKNTVSDSDPVSSKDSDTSIVIVSYYWQNESNDAKATDDERMNESCSKDAMPDVLKDQFLECHNDPIKQSDTDNLEQDYSVNENLVQGKIVPEDIMQNDFVNVRKLACCEKIRGNRLIDIGMVRLLCCYCIYICIEL